MRSQKYAVHLAMALSFCFFAAVKHAAAAEYLVTTPKAYSQALAKAKAGDVIKLADGVWRDFEILFTGEGEKGNPIRLTAQTKGKVILSGQSNLRLAGNYLEVSGLVFKDGYTPTQEVISFRKNKNELANNSRVTEVVIDNFNQPERQEADFWVMLYGKNNRFDRNTGRQAKQGRDDGGEGTRLRAVKTIIALIIIISARARYWVPMAAKHCASAPAIFREPTVKPLSRIIILTAATVSWKSFPANRAVMSSAIIHVLQIAGTLTMRHGNNTLVEGNVFFGADEDHTGGIRVINARQIVRNNYMQDIKGTRFGGALVV